MSADRASGAGLTAFPGWPAILRSLFNGQDLPREQARRCMGQILDGSATSAQIAAFAVALRMKGEGVDELAGMLDAMLEAAVLVPLEPGLAVIDTCGTGGDGSHSINISTLAALVVAGAGGHVCKHGNRAASSACGSADVLEALGVTIEVGPEVVARCVSEAGMGFCFAPRFHASMRHAGPTRREIGVPTAFNFLGPIANPGRVRRQVVGVSDASMADRVVAVLDRYGAERAMVVFGHDGMDELTTTTTSTVVDLRQGHIRRYEVDPRALGLAPATKADLAGGDAATNAEHALRVLGGQLGPHRDVVLLNAAAALVVAGLAEELSEGLELAASAIDSGGAAAALDRLQILSRPDAP